jgi:hypothetical protein
MKKSSIIAVIFLVGVAALLFMGDSESEQTTVSKTGGTEMVEQNIASDSEAQPEKKWCQWIADSDVVVQVAVPESYGSPIALQAGFSYSAPNSTVRNIRIARMARKECEYRAGFNFDELEKIKKAEIAVWDTDHNNRVPLVDEPVEVLLTDGIPDRGTHITVTLQ